jgi:2-polyprenyl-3-methyl-5-hydroxy-6-metoxy-1,4-benzoquinol methylase
MLPISMTMENDTMRSTYPGLRDQQQFWNNWNATLRDPTNLNEWTVKRCEIILRFVRSLAIDKPKILDFGCGTGWLTERLAEFGAATGIDLAEEAIATAQSRAPHVEFHAGDLFQIPLPKDYYDIVVSQDVIAHIPDQEAYVDRAADLLKAGGYLLLATPNKWVMDRSDWPAQPAEHIELWLTMTGLKRLLGRRFRILHGSSIMPIGNRGILKFVNSCKVNAALGLFVSQENLKRFKEWVGWGYELIALAQKRP